MDNKGQYNQRDLCIGICSLIISTFFLFTKLGKNLFIPFEDCPTCLGFYYYLISYGLAIAGIFFILKGLNIIKGE